MLIFLLCVRKSLISTSNWHVLFYSIDFFLYLSIDDQNKNKKHIFQTKVCGLTKFNTKVIQFKNTELFNAKTATSMFVHINITYENFIRRKFKLQKKIVLLTIPRVYYIIKIRTFHSINYY